VPGTDLGRFAEIALRDLPGVRVETGADEAEALIAAGAEVLRVDLDLVRRRLDDDPPPLPWAAPALPPGLRLAAVEDVATEAIAAAQRRACGDDHPDALATFAAQESGDHDALLARELLGPVLSDASGAVVAPSGEVRAALVATRAGAIVDGWDGGPWLVEVFAVPGSPPGLGTALVQRALLVLSLAGEQELGLSVNAGNRARRLYARLGFEPLGTRVALSLPGTWPR
jgi:ribosomal protein S18 acetylase RimI-like enzyme